MADHPLRALAPTPRSPLILSVDDRTLDDACTTCGERLLFHPRTLTPLGADGLYGWAFKLCDGTIVRVLHA